MGRNALALTNEAVSNLDTDRLNEAGIAAIELEQLSYAATANAKAIALQVGYDGSLSVGALEDEIRFYQRRTVEACLELGKRLLVLKELTPHGEFLPRLELLGFTAKTAQRLMSTTAKTSKSVNLSHLSTQVKSMSAFMELITHDEDVLENLADMDDVDKMSVSELRTACRKLKENLEDVEAVSAAKTKKLDSLKIKNSLTKLTEEELLAHKARPLYELIASAEILSTKLEKAVGVVLDEGDELLKAEAYNALTLITQYMLRAADKNYMPLDMEAIGLDTTDFETKALGLGALDEKEEA